MVLLRRLMVVLLALSCAPAFAQATAPVSVEFSLHAPGLSQEEVVYLSGGTPSLGNWDPRAVRMEYHGNDTWRAIVVFRRAMSVEYRYTLGSNDRVGADYRGQPMQNLRVIAQRNLDVTDEILSWTDAETVVEPRGQLSGDIRYHRHVRGDALPARDIVVWLPRFYALNTGDAYPVLYLNDGENIFDPATAKGGRDWGVDEAMQQLIDDDLLEPMIVVGIYSTADRLNEYTPGVDGEDYMRFVVETVKPLIDRRYRTREGRHHTFVGGAAMGGLIAFATAWTYPEVFGGALSFSPAFQLEGRIDALPWFAERAGEQRPVFFYLDVGGEGGDALLQPGVEAMVDLLRSWGYRPERNYVFIRDMDADHGIPAWSERFPEALARSVRGARRLEALAQRNEAGEGSSAFNSGFPVTVPNVAPASSVR
ncbi:MAG: alpha/beta hydrolase-fold protein [Pseudomonadota bacterium]